MPRETAIPFPFRTDFQVRPLGTRPRAPLNRFEDLLATPPQLSQLNEISSGRIGLNIFTNANSPVPRSSSVDSGTFVELSSPDDRPIQFAIGARQDWVYTNVIENPANLQHLGIQQPQSSLAAILGTDQWGQHFAPWLVYANTSLDIAPHWTLHGSAGHGERPPSITELYAAQPFMFLTRRNPSCSSCKTG